MISIGTDIVDISRIRGLPNKDRAIELIFSYHEQQELKSHADPDTFFASRFAGKEAVIKAMREPIGYHQFEIQTINRKPEVHFLEKRFTDITVTVSLSHEFTYATATAICS